MCELTELEMSNEFHIAIKKSSIKGIPSFEILYKEVVCQQGIADFVGLTSSSFVKKYRFVDFTSNESCSLVLSCLKYRAGRSKNYLKKQTDLTDGTLNRIIRDLVVNKYAVEKNNLYYLAIPNIDVKDNTWAFELKLSNWKRAIFQALQYKAFANYSVVVFPFEKERILKENMESFQELNIGVLLFSIKDHNTKWLYHPKKEKPISKWQTLFLLGKMSFQFSQENCIIKK